MNTQNHKIEHTRANRASLPGRQWVAIALIVGMASACEVGTGVEEPLALSASSTIRVSTKSEFLAALSSAKPGDHVQISPNAVIDLTGERKINVPAGVTLSGGRSKSRKGALLRTRETSAPGDEWIFLQSAGPDIVIRDLRIEGPDTSIGEPNTHMGVGIYLRHEDTMIKNCELYGWPRSAVAVRSFDGIVVRENFIHHNIRYGRGYGVSVGSGDGIPVIEYNYFDRNRHSIAGNGKGGYIVRHNSFFAGFLSGDSSGMHSQIDMHGIVENDFDIDSDQAGTMLHVYANDFVIPDGALGPIAGIRGVPKNGAWFEHNCVGQTRSTWLAQAVMTPHSSPQPGMNCYQKRDTYLCSTPAYDSEMQKITARNNQLGKATGCRGNPYQGSFADDEGHVHEAEIDELADKGIVSGCASFPEARFCPDKALTRGGAAKMIAKGFSLPRSGNYFDDDDGRWYEPYANALALARITTGVSHRTFAGDRHITRGELITFVSLALDLPPTSKDYFSDDAGRFYEDHANRARAAGITTGCGGDRFCGDEIATRAQGAAFVARALP